MPKSSTLMLPDRERRMFSGLRSRCTIPCSCAYTSARTTGSISSTARPGGTAPWCPDATAAAACSFNHSRRVCPSMYSSTMYGCPSCSPTSWITTMFSWWQRAVVRASARNRSPSPGQRATSSLTATSRPRRRSRARCTSPMPPRPSTRMSWYWPMIVPGTSDTGTASGTSPGSPEPCARGRSPASRCEAAITARPGPSMVGAPRLPGVVAGVRRVSGRSSRVHGSFPD